MEWNRVERHVGRLSHLTTVGLMLIQTQTWRGKDYCRLLEYLLRKLFKEGIIQNIQQYLSALCKSLTSALPFVALCLSPLCLPVHRGGSEQGFVKDIYQLAFPNTKAKQRWGCQRARVKQVPSGAPRRRRGLIAGTDVFVSSMAAWLMMNDFLSV